MFLIILILFNFLAYLHISYWNIPPNLHEKVHTLLLILVFSFLYLEAFDYFKVNESWYRCYGVTPHFRKLKTNCQNFGEAGSAITIDNDSSS